MPTDIESYKIKYDGGVGKSPNTYTPYKMKGHELPGPNQRTPSKMSMEKTHINEEMVDKTSKKSGVLYAEGGVGSSPAKGWLSNIGKSIGKIGKKAIGGGAGLIGKALGIGKKEEASAVDTTGASDGSDHTHEEFAQLDAAAQGGGTAQAATDMKKKKLWGGIGGVGGGDGTGLGGGSLDPEKLREMMKSGAFMSDVRAKEKIERTGESPSGIPTYEFNYIGDNNRYSGAMAQDLLEMNIDAVSMGDDGFYRVNYNNIDVDMRLIN